MTENPPASTDIHISFTSMAFCLVMPDHPPTAVKTAAEAREAILRFAMNCLGHHARDPDSQDGLHLRVGPDGPSWQDLAECETSRRYDPAEPEAGMTCSYVLYRIARAIGFPGIWMEVNAPPEVWDHPTDEPVALDNLDDRDNDSRPDSATNDLSELEGG